MSPLESLINHAVFHINFTNIINILQMVVKYDKCWLNIDNTWNGKNNKIGQICVVTVGKICQQKIILGGKYFITQYVIHVYSLLKSVNL